MITCPLKKKTISREQSIIDNGPFKQKVKKNTTMSCRKLSKELRYIQHDANCNKRSVDYKRNEHFDKVEMI